MFHPPLPGLSHRSSRDGPPFPDALRNVMWDSDVDFDLAAFHALVRALKRTLRQLVEASLAHVLLQEPWDGEVGRDG